MSRIGLIWEEFNEVETIFDHSPLPMWIYDRDSMRFLAVNKYAVKHYGYSEKEFLGMTIKAIRPQEDIPKLEKAIETSLGQTERYHETYFRHLKKNGDIMYVQIKSTIIHYEKKSAVLVFVFDLTENYEREQKIERQKEYLEAIGSINQILLKTNKWLESLAKCFKIVGETLDVDRLYYFKYNLKEQLITQQLEWVSSLAELPTATPTREAMPCSELASFSLFQESLHQNNPFEAIVRELASSPSKKQLKKQGVKTLLVLPVYAGGVLFGFIGIEDIKNERVFKSEAYQLLYALTSNLGHVLKRRAAYRKLSDSESRFKLLIENGQDLIAIIDGQGYYKYVASTSEKVLGIAPEEFVGKSAFDFIYKSDVPRIKQHIEALKVQKQVCIAPYRFMDAEGNWRWIRTVLSNHIDTPLIEGIVASTQEVTAEVEERLVRELVQRITSAIGQEGSVASGLDNALNSLVELSKISISEIWLLSPDATQLDLISKAYQDKSYSRFYGTTKGVSSFKKGKGFPGSVWKEQKVLTWESLSEHKDFVRFKEAAGFDLQTGIGVPIIYNNEFLGCIICFSKHDAGQLLEQVTLLTRVSGQLGAVIKQKITEEEYRNFFNLSPDPHCIIGFDGYMKKYNKAFFKLLGYEKKDLLERPFIDFIHEKDREASIKAMQLLIYSSSPLPYEVRFVTCNGEVKWLMWSGTVVRESKTVVAVAKDITEQKQAEQELQTAYERLKTAQKIAKLGYWSREIDSDVSIWSEETYQIYGYAPESFTPSLENIAQAFHPDDRYLIENNPNKHLIPGQVQSFEHRIITGSGTVKWVRQEIMLIVNGNGVPSFLEGTIQDITERKKYEEQLSISNERFRLAMQASNEMIWEIDHQEQKIMRGSVFKQAFKYGKKDVFSKDNSWFTKIHPDDRDMVWDTLNKAFQNKKRKSWRAEYRMELANGSTAYFADRCLILRDDRGRPIRAVGSALDVTASRMQLARIKKQNESLREIAWLQSHVIRAPLTNIMGLVYLSNELDGGGKTKDEILAMILDAANELDGRIRDIIDKTIIFTDDIS